MNLSDEQFVALIAAFIAILVAVPFVAKTLASARLKDAEARKLQAEAEFIEAQTRQRQVESDAAVERAETDTNREVTKTITGELVEERSENRTLQRELRDCKVEGAKKDAQITALQNLNTMLGERNEQQAKLLMDSAKRIQALEEIERHLRNKVTVYEIRFANQLDKKGNDNDS